MAEKPSIIETKKALYQKGLAQIVAGKK